MRLLYLSFYKLIGIHENKYWIWTSSLQMLVVVAFNWHKKVFVSSAWLMVSIAVTFSCDFSWQFDTSGSIFLVVFLASNFHASITTILPSGLFIHSFYTLFIQICILIIALFCLTGYIFFCFLCYLHTILFATKLFKLISRPLG